MPVLAAIDVGSNALRLAIGETDVQHRITMVESIREPVRLGKDVFTKGALTEETIEASVAAFHRFREAIMLHGAGRVRAVATSATRESTNRELFLDRIAGATGIDVEIIGPEEEARLIYLAVADKVNLKNKSAMLIDIGGGSTEISVVSNGTIQMTESFRLGAVRLLQVLEEKKHGEARFHVLLDEYMGAVRKRIIRDLGIRTFDLCVGTGGNIETLGDLRRGLLTRDRDTLLPAEDLEGLIKILQAKSYEQRVQELGLRPDRADVIIPAALVLRTILRAAKIGEIVIPGVGLKDGLLLDMVEEMYGGRRVLHRDQIVASALEVGRRYQFDEQHGTAVARYALQLFEQTRMLHNLGIEHRLILEVAALLHDIGMFINGAEHHKHTYYILSGSPLVGLSQSQMMLIANVARYHRKSLPKVQHDGYRMLPAKDRVVVSKLAAILRLADAMDNEHASKVTDLAVDFKKPKLSIRLSGEGDLLLEKWALLKKAELFEEVFNVKITIEE